MIIKKIINSILCFFFATLVYAQGEPLKVAVNSFYPPFVMQTTNKHFYGFDISLMENICKTLNRTCQFYPMSFLDLIPAVESNQVDVAVGSIIINQERATRVNFSAPYLLSHSRFLGPKALAKQPFAIDLLHNKTIGVEEGTLFGEQIAAMGVINPKIVQFTNLSNEIEALHEGKINFALMDAPAANYWQMQSSGSLVLLGNPVPYGIGIGIAVNKGHSELLTQINKALLQYKSSTEFKENYERYLKEF